VQYLAEKRGIVELTGADIGSITSAAFALAMDRTLKELAKEAILDHLYKNGRKNEEWEKELDGMSITSMLFANSKDERVLFGMDSKGLVNVVKSFVDKLPSRKLQVFITQNDFMIAASQCKATIVDEKYYKQLLSKYEDDILHELLDVDPTV
jgi:SpoVK/Ycf46/Vps4 family AAA+-type ATPase